MAELAGSLTFFEVTALVRFLCGLGKSGDLLLARDQWTGQLAIDRGRLVAAAADAALGPRALEMIAAVMAGGEFEFAEGPPGLAANLDPDTDSLLELERLTAGGVQLGTGPLLAPAAVPTLLESMAAEDAQLTLERVAIQVLADVNGVLTVRELGDRHGLARTLNALTRLRELDLVTFDAAPVSPREYARDSGVVATPPPIRSRWQQLRQVASRLGARLGAWSRHTANQRSRAAVAELVQGIVVTGLFILGLRTVVQNFRVEGVSMLPTFQGGQALVINRAAYLHVEDSPLARVVPTTSQGSLRYVFGGPQRGDVAVFRAPPQPDADYIKRIIGLPGESVLVRRGQVFIDGRQLRESYVDFLATYDFPPNGQPVVVPDGNYFVLGDNRPDSFDSHLGWFVPADNLIGRAWLRYWPPNELSVVQSGDRIQASAARGDVAAAAN